MTRASPAPPFTSGAAIAVVLPAHIDQLPASEHALLASMPHILAEHRTALARELGAPLAFVAQDPGVGPRWLIGPSAAHPSIQTVRRPAQQPELFLDRAKQLLITDAPTVAGVWETFSWLRSLAQHPDGVLRVTDCPDIPTAVERVAAEVGDSYPAFGLRDIDWAALCATYRAAVPAASNPIHALQAWLAHLQDAHTWVRPATPQGELPYEVWLTANRAVLTRVPAQSAAWEAGVRPGFRLIGQEFSSWWHRTAAPPHARPLVAGRRLMSGPLGEQRAWAALAPTGDVVRWSEAFPATRWPSLVSWTRLPSSTAYLRINAWRDATVLETAVDTALRELQAASRLIVDLRGNGGGDLSLAHRFRNRFLRQATTLGTIRYSMRHNVLSDPEVLAGEPAPAATRWRGRVRFLTDPLTYSASEDVLLGLQGLAHVEVVGEPSGGGSGRPRVLRLVPGWSLTVSTALTYDRQGRCVEHAGIAVDVPVQPDRFGHSDGDVVLERADQAW